MSDAFLESAYAEATEAANKGPFKPVMAEPTAEMFGSLRRELDWIANERDALRTDRDALAQRVAELEAGLHSIAQHDPRWKGPRVTASPNRDQLIAKAFDSLRRPSGA